MKRLLVPVVRQSSVTSSGAAALASVCLGFGIPATEADVLRSCDGLESGICLDDLELEAKGLGFTCDQLLLPLDHLLATNANIPAIAVTRTAVGHLGSVVIWQQLCGLVQVMDPLSGRRWLSRKALIDQLYCHSQEVEADALSSWMRTAAFEWPLEVRLQELGIPEAHTLIANAACEPGWRGIATLDAVVREVAEGGGGRQATVSNRHLVLTNWKRALVDPASVPGQFWFARVHADGVLRISGAVILRFQLREKHCRV